MPQTDLKPTIRPLDELDIGAIVRIDERIGGVHRPDFWEQRVGYYLRRDPECSRIAEIDGRAVGFMLGDIRAGEFGLDEPSGWIERFGVDPDYRGRDLGRLLFDALVATFRARGVTTIRTLVARDDAGVARFLEAVGFSPSPLQALEIRVAPAAR